MKKNNKNLNTKGFVMSELLAGAIVILLLFSILFANYLPLSGEFETRIAYSNVTANYGAFYVRKIYKAVLEDSTTHISENDTAKDVLDAALSQKGYYTVYTAKNPEEIRLISKTYESDIADIIEEYQIEEIIITKYKTDEVKKGIGGDTTKRYTKADGVLYKYIKYLPKYQLAPYDGKSFEPYRLIMKTNYGYATTQILPDPPTPISCFDLVYKDNLHGFAVTEYHSEKDECGESVNITSNEINYNGYTAPIVSIASTGEGENIKGAFEGKGISYINLAANVKTIGDNAFKNNNISRFDFEDNAPGVTQVGKEAFSDNKLTRIVIPANVTLGESAFANNYNLKNIDFAYDSLDPNNSEDLRKIPNGLFSISADHINDANLINLMIPANVTEIGENAFHNLQFSSIEFENTTEVDPEDIGEGEEPASPRPSKLEIIYKNAFKIDGGAPTTYQNYISLFIPSSVKTIGESAFENVKIGTLIFDVDNPTTSSSSLKSIGDKAFKVDTTDVYKNDNNHLSNDIKADLCIEIFTEEESGECVYTRSLTIPSDVQTIGIEAFANQQFSSIIFIETKLTRIGSKVFDGNNLTSIALPGNLAADGNPTSIEVVGTAGLIFGDNSFGDEEGQIGVMALGMFADDKDAFMCKALVGNSSCNKTQVDEEGFVYSYSSNGKTKYVTYMGE